MSPLLLLPALLMLIALAVLLAIRNRRRGSQAATPDAARDGEEVRLLRLQVKTLTDALHEVNARNAVATASTRAAASTESTGPAAAIGSALAPVAGPPARVTEHAPETPADEVAAADEAFDALSGPLRDPLPDLPTPRPADLTARAYAALSRSLAADGRVREAVLAQWAADVRVLAPLLSGRGAELCAALGELEIHDPAASLVRARAAASGLVGPSFALSALLTDLTHLSGSAASGRPGATRDDVSAEALPDHVVRALESVLNRSAALAGDRRGVSVGLRCDLVAHVVATETPEDVENRVRDILEPHEQDRFDTVLAGLAS